MEADWPGDQIFGGWQGRFWKPSLAVHDELEDSGHPKQGWQQDLQGLLWTPKGKALPRIRKQIKDRLKVMALASRGQPDLQHGMTALRAVESLAHLNGSCFCSSTNSP